MTTTSTRPVRLPAPAAQRRYGWLALGAALQLLAVGGRWDIALAAWVFPIFLLRFVRVSRPAWGLLLVVPVFAAGGLFWAWQLAVPFTVLTVAGVISLAVVVILAYAADRFAPPKLRLLTYPATLTASAFLLGSFSPFGTAYGLQAVTQHDNLALLQATSVAGPYVITFLIGLVATAANHLWEHGISWSGAKPALVTAAVLAAVLGLGQAWLAWAPAATSPTVRIGAVNPSNASLARAQQLLGTAPTDLAGMSHRDPSTVRAAADVINRQLFADTRQAAQAGAKIVVWSENAARFRAVDEPAFLAEAGALARETGIYLEVAANVYLPDAPYGRDQTVLLGPDGAVRWTYQKHHPIPGLENYAPGSGPVPVIDTPYGRLSSVICYDADFLETARVATDIMLVPGGDWPEMGRIHTQMASLRAIENGYALVRADLNGSSQAFDRQGHVLSQQDTTPGDNAPWLADVPTQDGARTLYGLVGNWFAWVCTAGALVAVGLAVRARRP
ncbi:carbon-nitrogen hydrolase family protein [Amycolatopsis jejuensis]|uniref:carbon-nitrogen hydrolase family protein n=1 Tax=Amycolatopsis jejuensis TaxID=330084 RepID=UPI00068E4B44|nr:carbon-nitrogen hydrolase family protein [Amycolatopsis jejuensis]